MVYDSSIMFKKSGFNLFLCDYFLTCCVKTKCLLSTAYINVVGCLFSGPRRYPTGSWCIVSPTPMARHRVDFVKDPFMLG